MIMIIMFIMIIIIINIINAMVASSLSGSPSKTVTRETEW